MGDARSMERASSSRFTRTGDGGTRVPDDHEGMDTATHTTEEITVNLSTATPREIDEALAEIYTRAARPRQRAADALKSAARYERTGGRWLRDAEAARERAERYRAEAQAIETEADPYEAEYTRRGGWARYFWCQSDGGHIHSGRQCSSIRPTTVLA